RVDLRIRTAQQAADDGHHSREVARRISTRGGVCARRRGPHLHLRRSRPGHTGVPVNRRAHIAAAAVVLVSAVVAASTSFAQLQTPAPAVLMSQASQFFENLDYEHALSALDQAIVVLEGRPLQDPVRRSLPVAYEMRARSQYGLGKEAEARADFVALLKVDPVYTLTGQVTPKVVAIFDEVMKATVTTMKVAARPR